MCAETSLIVQNFSKISVSVRSFIFLPALLSLFLFFGIFKAGWDAMKRQRELHELLYTEMVKSRTIRLASDVTDADTS